MPVEVNATKTVAPIEKLIMPTACCCERCSWYVQEGCGCYWDDCLGGASRGVFLCCEGSGSFVVHLEAPKLCCKSEATQCCIDVRAALPTDDDVPFAIGCCGTLIYEATPGLWGKK